MSTVVCMGREPRIQAAGVYHVTTRGNNREAIVRDAEDRLSLLAELERVIARHCWVCHAYCVMGNHLHLVLEILEPTLAQGMQQLQSNHARRFNKRYGRTGHLFGRRYFSLPLVDDTHLLELSRYVVLNPVRAGACRTPEEWLWSSYRAMVGLAPRPEFLTIDWLLAQFGRDVEEGRRQYARFVAGGR